MADTLSALEVLEIAEQVQFDAIEFYREASTLYSHHSNLFLDIVMIHEQYRDKYSLLKSKVAQQVKANGPMDDSLCKSVAALNVFSSQISPEQLFRADMRKNDILKIVLREEQNVLTYLTGLDNFVADNLAKGIVANVVQIKKSQLDEMTDWMN